MFDIWIGEMNLTVLVIVCTVVIALPVQLLLCFKVKSRIVRLLPIILCLLLALLGIALACFIPGWGALSYLFISIYAGIMMLTCGLGWTIWAIANYFIKKQQV